MAIAGSPPAPASLPTQVHFYDLGILPLAQTAVAGEVREMPVPLRGILARPEGAGPFPVVVILHGRHAGCHFAPAWEDSRWPCPTELETRFDQGFAYLAEALAEQGYIALAIDLNGAYAFAYGATPQNYTALTHQRSPQILAAHLARLAAAHQGESVGFGVPLTGQVDLSRLVLIGHSMGGAAAVFSGLEPAGLLLVAPTPSLDIATFPKAYALPDVPTSILLGDCDRDVYDFSSLYYFEAAAQPPRQHWLANVLMAGANHHFFNRALAEDDYTYQPDNSPQCGPQQPGRLSRADQEAFLVGYATRFLQRVFDPEAEVGLALSPAQAAPGRLLGVPVLTNLYSGLGQRRVLALGPDSAPDGGSHLEPSPHLSVQICAALQTCDRFWRPRPHFPTVLRLNWRQSSQSLRLALPPSGRDVSRFSSLQLRLAVDATDALTDGQAVALAVVLQDRQGRAVRVEIPATTPALRVASADPRSGYQGIPIYPSAVRIPLAQFQGVNLADLAAATLVFDRNNRGVLYLADIAFL